MLTDQEKAKRYDTIVALLTLSAGEKTIFEDEDGNPLDDVMIDDFAGGNVDDAFWCGDTNARIDYARELLKVIT